MEKRIIAVVCVVILMTTLFASCGKKLYMKEINGVERPVVTDENGELFTDNEGLIRVYETNTKGQIVTNKNGEPEYNYIQPPQAYLNGNKVVNGRFTLGVPEGFEANESGEISKKGTDGNCTISVSYAATVSAEQPFAAFINQTEATNNEIMKRINDGEVVSKGYKKAESEFKNLKLGDTDARYSAYKIVSTDDKVVHYAVSVYFLLGEEIYVLNYACVDGIGYDESFDFSEWIENSFTIGK